MASPIVILVLSKKWEDVKLLRHIHVQNRKYHLVQYVSCKNNLNWTHTCTHTPLGHPITVISVVFTNALRTDGRTGQRTDKPSYGDARTHLKIFPDLRTDGQELL